MIVGYNTLWTILFVCYIILNYYLSLLWIISRTLIHYLTYANATLTWSCNTEVFLENAAHELDTYASHMMGMHGS